MLRTCLPTLLLACVATTGYPGEDVATKPPPITGADWAMYNHDVRGWRYNSAEKALRPETVGQLVEKWRFPGREFPDKVGVIHATPTVVNGHAYFGTATYAAFYKLRPDGTVSWIYRPSASSVDDSTEKASRREGGPNKISGNPGILGSALVTDRAVFFGDIAGVFYALDRTTGKELWKVNTRIDGFPGNHPVNTFMSSAISADGKVVVGGGGYEHPYPLSPSYPCCTGRGFVVAFDPDDGDVVWKYDVGPKPEKFDEPVVIEDGKGKHVYKYGPATSSVWSSPSFDAESGTIFFGTDVQNSPRKPTDDNPRLDTKYSSAVVAVDVATGKEKWVTQINKGDIFNHTMSGYDPHTKRYKDLSIGDTPKIYTVAVDDKETKVVGVGCKNGGYYVMRADTGAIVRNTPIFKGEPKYPLRPEPDPRMIALPSPIGGIQTGCATDGERVFTNGIDFLLLSTKKPGRPEGGRVVSLTPGAEKELWRHERKKILGRIGDPVGAGIALAGGLVFFTTTISERLVVLDADTGRELREFDIGVVWSGPSVSRGRVFVGTGSALFFKKKDSGTLFSFGLPDEDEIDRMGKGNE